MNQEDKLRKLIARAQAEAPPKVHVADRVLAALLVMPPCVEKNEPFLWVAAPAAAAAVAAVLLGFSNGATWSDLVLARLSDLPWWML